MTKHKTFIVISSLFRLFDFHQSLGLIRLYRVLLSITVYNQIQLDSNKFLQVQLSPTLSKIALMGKFRGINGYIESIMIHSYPTNSQWILGQSRFCKIHLGTICFNKLLIVPFRPIQVHTGPYRSI